jgi:hypothetical protein
MRRLLTIISTALLALALFTPSAFAFDGGEGWYGVTTDKVVTNAGFILIVAFPAIIALLSAIQWKLEKRKDARKAAVKARAGRTQWRGGW